MKEKQNAKVLSQKEIAPQIFTKRLLFVMIFSSVESKEVIIWHGIL